LEALGLRKQARNITALTEEQITAGLKEALATGIERSVTNLGRADGFLKDTDVRIPLPPSLRWADKSLRAIGQEQLSDEFVTTLNRAAEQAMPAAGPVLGDAVRQMTLADARSILSATNAAATAYFRRTSEATLHERLLPLVRNATANTGVTAQYKAVLDKVGLGREGGLGSLGRTFLGTENLDLDSYVTSKALDGLFTKVAEEEERIRANPAARTTELLRKVFGNGR
jgi:hypothetical protein